jgi:RNA polymerase sigma factor for flagellar operon FliA
MLHNNRFHSFGEGPDGDHPFDAEETQQNLRTSALNDPERKGLLELLAERIAQLPEAPKKVLAMYYYEGSNLADIATCFNLTETQIYQIHMVAVDELRKYLCGAWVKRERNDAS